MTTVWGPRRAAVVDVDASSSDAFLEAPELAAFETLDLLYRALCALLFNYVPTSGHPGGSISSGRFAAAVLFDALDYDLTDPDREDADILSYAAGHKAMGLYAMWALRDEIARLGAPELLPADDRQRLRLEDLLGFRRNPTTQTPLFRAMHAKALDGHPTPATPFVRLATGASGVGLASSIGLAIGARDRFGADCPRIHISEGEGGLTPGRVGEALAAAGTASLGNVVTHLDWNQASIDSDRVCREGSQPGDYVQWDPSELFYLHDWNVVRVADGHNFQQVVAAQRHALAIDNGQPTAMIYRTLKGWQYGVEGRASHGAGHKLCSAGFYEALSELTGGAQPALPTCDPGNPRCAGPAGDEVREACFWAALQIVRRRLEEEPPAAKALAARLVAARERLERRGRRPRPGAPRVEAVYELASRAATDVPDELRLTPGARTTLRDALGRSLALLNETSGGALLTAAADLLGSTSVSLIAAGFPAGYWNAASEPRRAAAVDRRHLRGRHRRGAFRHLRLRPCHRRGLVVRRLHGAARPHRRPPARHRRPGTAGRLRRALPADDPGLRAYRLGDRRRRSDARRPAGAATPPGELPARHGHHAHALGATGDLGATGQRARAAGRRSSRPS